MKKKQRVENENHERYIVTYADLLTLLLAFFVILYAMSDPNPQKIDKLGNFFESAFNPRVEKIQLIESDQPATLRTYRQPLTEEQAEMMKAISEQNNLRKIKNHIENRVEQEGMEEYVSTTLNKKGLKIILTNEILFESGSDEINNQKSKRLLSFIGEILVGFDNKVSIGGHTDNVPINNSKFSSNWELSSARAISVLHHILTTNEKLDPSRFSSIGYGQFDPIASNDSAVGRQKNRRVEIVVKRQHSDGLLTPKEGGVNE